MIHYISLSNDWDLLFESIIATILLYAYLVNKLFHSIVARNNINESIVISRYLRLEIISKINYNNYYQVSSDEANITLIFITFENTWYNKELITLKLSKSFVASLTLAISISIDYKEIKLVNKVIVFNKQGSSAMKALRKVINSYSLL